VPLEKRVSEILLPIDHPPAENPTK